MTIGHASLSDEAVPSIPPFIHGPVLRETVEAMSSGLGGGKKLNQAVIDGVKAQVTDILGSILGAYEALVAKGEVGPGGSARAAGPTLTQVPPTGLLYGRVQSGKTNAMIMLTAMAIDNGFRVVIVLTSDNVSLVKQTADRFQILQGITVKGSTAIGSWVENPDFKESLRHGGLVLVTAKNKSHLDTFLDFLRTVDAGSHPALILDDEADQATLDTTVHKKSVAVKKGKPIPTATSAIYEKHTSMRDLLPHHVYLQVTATPYALVLQNLDHPLRPRFTNLLEPGKGYTGGEFFFPKAVFDEGRPPLSFVAEDEDDQLVDPKTSIPNGLEEAIAYFLVAACAQALANPTFKHSQQNLLCHTSFKKSEHMVAADKIRKFVATIRDDLRAGGSMADVTLRRGLNELERSGLSGLPTLDAVKELLGWKLRNFEVFIINSEHDDLALPPKMNFVVGGNILGRGMTIDNLLVTYYLRSTKIAQMDTVLQHARMFGYREEARPYLRVFLPQLQALRFLRIQQAEDELRELQASNGADARLIPVRASKDMRPTRTNVLDANNVFAYHPGQHLYPELPYHGSRADQKQRAAYEWFRSTFNIVPGEHAQRPLRIIPLELVFAALEHIPFDENNAGNWSPAAIKSVLETSSGLFAGKAKLYTRIANRETLSEGMLGPKELKDLRNEGLPVLCVFVDTTGKLALGTKAKKGPSLNLPLYVFPEIVLPRADGMAVHVFNDS